MIPTRIGPSQRTRQARTLFGYSTPMCSRRSTYAAPCHYGTGISVFVKCLEAVFTITLGCSVIERRLEPMPMSGRSDMEDSLGQQDLARARDRDRGLRAAPRAWTGPPAVRDGAGAADLAALPA